MGGAQRIRRLFHDPAGFFYWERAAPADPGRHRFSVDETHYEVDETLALTDGVDGHYVRVREAGSGLGFAGESLSDILLKGQLGGQHFDGHPPLEPLVPGPIDHPHAAAADLALYGIGIAQCLG
jgi:hypothetical protein